MAIHGAVRSTGDLDLLVRPDPENAERVFRALVDFGAPVDARRLTVRDLAQPGTAYQIGVAPRRIDVLTEISGLDFDAAWSSHVSAEFGRLTVPFLGRQALLQNKRASGRAKDLADIELLGGA